MWTVRSDLAEGLTGGYRFASAGHGVIHTLAYDHEPQRPRDGRGMTIDP